MLMPPGAEFRLAVVNSNVPGMVAEISGLLGKANVNIVDLLNKSRDDMAYTLIDTNDRLDDSLMAEVKAIDGVLSARQI